MSEKQNFKIIKTTPSAVLFDLHPVSNYGLTRRIYLTNNNPQQALPLDWALGVFQTPSIYAMYKQGYFTFDDNESLVKAAFEAGVYFDDVLDFTPTNADHVKEIVSILKSGNRANILNAIEKYGKDIIIQTAQVNLDSLTQGVISMLENTLKTQLVLDQD